MCHQFTLPVGFGGDEKAALSRQLGKSHRWGTTGGANRLLGILLQYLHFTRKDFDGGAFRLSRRACIENFIQT